jgi:pimeloyl-ACP methyl ester carboxylesterase
MSNLLDTTNQRVEQARSDCTVVSDLSGGVRFHRAEERHAGSFFVARPETEPELSQILVAVHGISRDAREQVEMFGHVALTRGWTVVAPLFDMATHPQFQQLGICRRHTQARADLALLDMLDTIVGAEAVKFCLFGFSGGAQFAHRFALFHPERVTAMALGAAGWYTFPKAKRPYPRGINVSESGNDLTPRLAAMLEVPCAVFVGERDTLREKSFNTTPKIDRDQGSDRIERARRWVEAMRAAGAAMDVSIECELELLAGCGHSFRECVNRGGLVDKALDFFERINGRGS